MYVIRPITFKDLDALESFAKRAAIGLTSLPKDRTMLHAKIEKSLKSFSQNLKQESKFVFVLENTETGEVGGTCSIYGASGLNDPLYFYRIEMIHPKSSKVPLPEELILLHPVSIKNGPSELCGIYMQPEWRKEHLGSLLSLSRLLFIASFRDRFKDTLMARMRGWIDREKNSSPFWDGFGSHFAKMSFLETQILLISDQSFIPEILPKHPIYISLLPKNVQNMIGKTHPTTKPALKMLLKENMQLTHEVDVFDAGPTISAKTDDIRTLKEQKEGIVTITENEIESSNYIIANTSLDYRACYGNLLIENDTVILSKETAVALKVQSGDKIRYIASYHI